jgi:predicted secreted protein
MAVINGTTMLLILDGVRIGATTSATLNINVDTPEATNKDSAGWGASINGVRSWDVSFDGFHDPAGTMSTEQIYDYISARDASIYMEFATIDGTGGGELYRGAVLVTSLSITADMEAPVTISGSLKGTGALSKGTVTAS